MLHAASRVLLLVAVVALAGGAPAAAQSGEAPRKVLDHDVYDTWNRIGGSAVSEDGRWVLHAVTSEGNDGQLTVTSVAAGGGTHVVERGEGARFSVDGRFVAFTIKPSKAALKEARERRVRTDQLPPDTLGVLDLATGEVLRAARVRSFRMPEKSGGWVAYLLGREPNGARGDTAQAGAAAAPPAPGATPPVQVEPGRMPEPPVGEPQRDTARSGQDRRREEGTPLVLRILATGEERRVEDVVWYDFSKDGARLAYTRSNRAGDADGVYVMDTRTGAVTTLMAGKGDYRQVAFSEDGRQVAFLSNTADYEAKQPAFALYLWDGRAAAARKAVDPAAAGIPRGWWVSEHGTIRFSQNGQRVLFGTSQRPEPAPERSSEAADERVVVDIWNWRDPLIQPMQLRQLEQERRRAYDAVLHVRDGRVVQLATPEIPNVTVALRGDGAFAFGSTNVPYRQEISWGESGSDIYHIDVRTGEATLLRSYLRSNASLSPEARYITWFDGEERAWFVMDVRSRSVRSLSAQIPFAVHNELHDAPSLPGSYGSAGWTTGDTHFLVYDAYDIWAVDPTGRSAPRNVTDGLGRRESVRFRYVRLDPEERAIDPAADLLLSAFNERTRADGYYRDRISGSQPPVRLIVEDKRFGTPTRARNADVLVLTRSDFREFPDLWVTDGDFREMRKLSSANPQQAEYRWGTAELVSWRSGQNEVLEGILYKPDDFDPTRKYPMMVYFYERLSGNLHQHVVPAPGSSSINISFYVSRGYLVFTPDIPYRIGYPGESAYNAVIPGVLSLLPRGYIDEKRIGVQGHSWGGYQIAYLVTKTDLFAAAEAGAPVSNMVSAYGGIRWESGMVRQFQYEKAQSRLGASLWESPMRYIENSPIFWADKVNTPLLMMHNDEDGAVPWEQGIEYFVALRRLGKPVWMLNYNGEAHGLRKMVNRKDWTVRMQQFFDHYLMDAPPPVWMVQGVPATEKGRSLGLDLVTPPIMQ
jgi:dipeptidyl aminopeptidase/acylaminoacyl peptidase